MADIWEPSPDGRAMKALRFLNLLDDCKNIMSPVKFNLWAANIAACSTVAAGIVSWMGGHLGLIPEIGSLVGGWLGQAHTYHHFDKRERNKQMARMKGTIQ